MLWAQSGLEEVVALVPLAVVELPVVVDLQVEEEALVLVVQRPERRSET